ncbi:MAG: histidinol-phosphate transaminase [Actinomycetaceae bacterium]|nr:histidinol-phosphate transaminase [Actinomycetaceae bacterium]
MSQNVEGNTTTPSAYPQQWFRPEILDIPAYVPGGVVDDPEVIKLASNELPFPPLKQVEAAVQAGVGDLNRYPDMFATDLRADLARFHEWDGGIVIGGGSTALIEKIMQAVVRPERNRVIYAWRSFEAYPIAVRAVGGESVRVPLTTGGAHDLEAMLAQIDEQTAAIMVCSPNNPTGVALTHSEVESFLERVPTTIPVVLDEAYIDFVDMDDAVNSRALLDTYPNLVVLRTFSKAYGLAALRCGYALCSPEFAAALSAIMTPFGVNSLAQAAARAALESQIQMRGNVEWVRLEREKVLRAVADMGFDVPASQSNFVWFEVGERTPDFVAACEAEKLRVRAFAGEGVRVSIGEASGTQRLLRALQSL